MLQGGDVVASIEVKALLNHMADEKGSVLGDLKESLKDMLPGAPADAERPAGPARDRSRGGRPRNGSEAGGARDGVADSGRAGNQALGEGRARSRQPAGRVPGHRPERHPGDAEVHAGGCLRRMRVQGGQPGTADDSVHRVQHEIAGRRRNGPGAGRAAVEPESPAGSRRSATRWPSRSVPARAFAPSPPARSRTPKSSSRCFRRCRNSSARSPASTGTWACRCRSSRKPSSITTARSRS